MRGKLPQLCAMSLAMTDQFVELRYGLESFKSDWRQCSLGSDFLAETAFSTPQAKEIASTVVNEFLELAFRLSASASKSWVQTMVFPGQTMTLELDVVVRPELLSEVKTQVLAFRDDPAAYYESQLGAEAPGVFFGIGYLAHDLAAVISTHLKADVLLIRGNVNLKT